MAVLLVLVVAGLSGCGGPAAADPAVSDPAIPKLGSREFIAAERQWPAALRREFELEPMNMELLREPCGVDVDAGEFTEGVAERMTRADVPAAMNSALGRNWGDAWIDRCDRGRLKIGVPLGPRDEVRRKLVRARRVLRDLKVADMTDLVAVPASSPSLSAAQERIHNAGVGDDEDLFGGLNAALNMVHVEVARDVDGDGWRTLRRVAKASGVNVLLERVDAPGFRIDTWEGPDGDGR
jgi:hypothetical protein